MAISVGEIHKIFEQLVEDGLEDCPVIMLHQPQYPFYLSIKGVGSINTGEEDENGEKDDEDMKIVIVEEAQEGYGCSFEDVEYF